MYRVPMDAPNGVACLWGLNAECRYRGAGEELLVGNCDAAAYSESVKGGGMKDNCRAGWITRYPAAGSGDVAVVPAAAASTSSSANACPAVAEPVRSADACGAGAVPTPSEDQVLFAGYDRGLGWLDRGASEIRKYQGPGLLTWCGAEECFAYNASEMTMASVAYSAYSAIAGPAVDRARGHLYYIACSGGLCATRDPTTAACTDVTTQLCGEYACARAARCATRTA